MSKEYTAFNGDAFWNDGYVQELDMAETAVYFHYITSPRLENSGVFKETQRMVGFYVKADIEAVKKADAKLEKDGKIYRIGEWVIIPTSIKHQRFDRNTKVIAGIREQLRTAPVEVLDRLRQCGYALDLSFLLSPKTEDKPRYPLNTPSIYSDSDSYQDSNNNSFGDAERPEAEPPGGPPKPPPEKPKKLPLREREPVNDFERVEKAYLVNWAALFRAGKVKTPEPITNWNQTRKLLKTHFVKLKPDIIIAALTAGMNDEFILGGGYSLGVMLSASVLNRLINAGARSGTGPPSPDLTWKKSLGELEA